MPDNALMSMTKISSIVDAEAWQEFKELAGESHRSISGFLTETIREYVHRRRVRPEVMAHLEDWIRDNEELGRLLAD